MSKIIKMGTKIHGEKGGMVAEINDLNVNISWDFPYEKRTPEEILLFIEESDLFGEWEGTHGNAGCLYGQEKMFFGGIGKYYNCYDSDSDEPVFGCDNESGTWYSYFVESLNVHIYQPSNRIEVIMIIEKLHDSHMFFEPQKYMIRASL